MYSIIRINFLYLKCFIFTDKFYFIKPEHFQQFDFFENYVQNSWNKGRLGSSVVERLPLAQGMIWSRIESCIGLLKEPASPPASVSAYLCLS